ncbi:TonB-dependent receptor [Reichenbachiella agarivorans]|uniref:TonB-dependent receptor n=1 Tax=Reichenbachiella agarivorans TaxID=2979464 RepID=A0ABY6CQ80_9BACT|nr:TonB-dependent receptor [Reichenbachiella agarivorans]UXP32677.1 TonB-dependent receptor [Reichenbachiella agarivorans]
MRYIIYTLILTLINTATWAQQGSISGTIQEENKQPAAYVNVGIQNTSIGTTTDSQGRFELRNIKAGNYTIQTSSVGFISHEIEVSIAAGEHVILPIITLKEDIKSLNEVVVEEEKDNPYKDVALSNSLKLKTPILETPQNIQTVSAGMLAGQQVISMSDGVIRNVSGTARIAHWGDMFTKINMRGSRVQAFRNGVNVVNSSWGPLTEDMSYVDHIEFVKGPAGFMLSNGDPAGLYNVVTKKPTGETKGSVGMTMGSFDLYRATLDLDGKLSKNGKLLYRLNAAAQNKGSHRPYEYNNRFSIAPVISYQIDNKTRITAEYTYQHANMSNVGSYYVFSTEGYGTLPRDFTTLPKGMSPTNIDDQSIFINLEHHLNDNWSLTTQIAYLKYEQEGSSFWPAAVNPDGTMLRGSSIWDAESKTVRGQAFINGEAITGEVRHRVLGGIDIGTNNYIADWNQWHALDTLGNLFDTNNPNYGTPPNGFPNFDRTTSLENRASIGSAVDQQYSGLYLQDELAFFDNKVRLTLAGRYSYVTQTNYGITSDAKRFTPRVGLSASLNNSTTVYAMYDQAFIPQNGILKDGGDVQPITGNNMEVGVKKQWAGGRWSTTLTTYRIIKRNELTGDPVDPTSGLSVELGEKTSQGVEFDLKGNIITGLDLITNYAYTDSKVTEVSEGITSISKGDVVPGFAKHTANAWLTYTLQQGALQGTGISLGGSYLGERALGTWSNDTDAVENLPDYFKMDGGLSWTNDKLRINLNVYNLLDEYLYDGGYYGSLSSYWWQTEPGRNYKLSVAYNF